MEVEKTVLGGTGSVDVALEREGRRIACEICVSTGTEHELENVRKCLAGGFGEVYVLAAQRERSASLRETIQASLTAGEREQVRGVSPDDFFSAVDSSWSRATQTTTVRGIAST